VRVLHLLSSPVWSGPAEAVALVAEAQRSLGHAVSVAIDSTRAGTGTEEPAAPRLEALGLLDSQGLRLSTRDGAAGVWRDARLLGTLEADVVHSHFSHDHWVAALSGHRGTRVRSFHAARSRRSTGPRRHSIAHRCGTGPGVRWGSGNRSRRPRSNDSHSTSRPTE